MSWRPRPVSSIHREGLHIRSLSRGINSIRRSLKIMQLMILIIVTVAILSTGAEAYNMARFGTIARKVTASAIVASGFALTGAQELPKSPWVDVIPIAHAASTSIFEGEYLDPNHPEGMRKVTVDGNDVTLRGTDSKGGKEWVLKAKEEAGTIFVDFSPKGGPKDLLGVFDEGKGTKGGITWPDKNTWTKL